MSEAAKVHIVDDDRVMSWRAMGGLPLLLLAVHAALGWWGRAPGILTGQDDVRYLMLARALHDGAYRDLMWPGAPLHHMYPPGYPALLSLWTAIGGEGFDWLVVLHIALSVGTLALLFLSIRRLFPPTVVLATMAALVPSPGLLQASGEVASENALALCLVAAVSASVCLKPSRMQVIVLTLLAIAAPFTRGAGIILPVAIVIFLASERRMAAAAAVAVLSVACVGPLLWWTLNDPYAVVGSSYAADLIATNVTDKSPLLLLARRAATHFVDYFARGIPWMLPTPTVQGTVIDNAISSGLIVLGLAVGTVALRARLPMAGLVLITYIALLLVWAWQVTRFVVPLMPIIVPIMMFGLWHMVCKINARAAPVVIVVIAASIALGGAARAGERAQFVANCDRTSNFPDESCISAAQAGFFRTARFVRDSIPKQARVVSAKSEPLSYFSGRVTIPLARLAKMDSAAFWKEVKAQGAEYLLLGDLQTGERKFLAPTLEKRCRSLTVAVSDPPHTYLFRILADSSASATGSASGDSLACAVIGDYRKAGAQVPPLAVPGR